ncbi:MAG: 23S rRNA (uracil(1939)-C(5))-methyltransferase RlmD [Clostridia bacterium]|nr:23S rRNA (uracil(1939)-C(5))-methyltransferase RlmD [Clostridia bacterium]
MNRAHNCDVYKKCSGCQLTNLTYEEQLSFKMKKVISLLGRFSRIDEIIGMETPLHYRNKMQAAFTSDTRRNPISGVWQTEASRVVKTDSCLIENEQALWIVRAARGMLRDFGITVYDPKSRKGSLRHIMVRNGAVSGEYMVVLVTADMKAGRLREFSAALARRFPYIRTVVQVVNDTNIPLWMGEKQTVLYGEGYIEDTLCSCRFKISPRSFYQINHTQTEVLYSKAVEFAGLKNTDKVIDAYCGIGTIGIIAAKTAGTVLGVETVGDAVLNARENAKLNGIENYKVFKDDAGEFMTKLSEKGEKVNVVFTDPPRSGCSKEFLNSLVKLSPERVVYVSCNPETLARDLEFLRKNKYKVEKIQPVDMFPHTRHCEVVCALRR